MTKLKRVAIFFGGKSAEHEISLISGMNIVSALDRSKFDPVLIGIGKNGGWFLQDESQFMANSDDPQKVQLPSYKRPVGIIPERTPPGFIDLTEMAALENIDAAFSIVHGPMGEDGTLQGLFEQLHVPYVGAGVLGSAAGMDKVVFKQLMTQVGIANSAFVHFLSTERALISFESVKKKLGVPLFIKPANMGSSVGISKANTKEEFEKAVDLAFQFDEKILIEEFIKGREIECAVLGNLNPKGSVPGEIIPQNDFYSYEAKYIDESGAALEAPAKNLSEETVKHIQAEAIKAFKAIGCEGLARVDFFLTDANQLIINEINTLPGFTKISMYPRLWSLSGIGYTDLITRLIELAIERHERKRKLKTSLLQ